MKISIIRGLPGSGKSTLGRKISAESGVKKPTNLILIISSPLINHEAELSLCPHADKVFTVYTKEYAEENNIVINCGKHKCLSCLQCYSKAGSPTIINELLK